MKERKKNKRNFLFIAIPILLVISLLAYFFISWLWFDKVKFFFRKVVVPKKIIWSVDEIYSENEKKLLEKFVQNSIDSGMFNFDTSIFYKELKKNHKVVKGVEWNFSNPDFAQLKIYGITPKYLINNKFVLGNKKRLFDKDKFNNFDNNRFMKINIAQHFLGEKLDFNLYDFLNKISKSDCWNKFEVSYFDSTKIEMLSKDFLPEYLVRVDKKNFDNTEKLGFVNSIYDDLVKELEQNPRKYRNKFFAFDLRFGDRIYLQTLKLKDLKHNLWGGGNG